MRKVKNLPCVQEGDTTHHYHQRFILEGQLFYVGTSTYN